MEYAKADPQTVSDLAKNCNIHPFLAKLLVSRNIRTEAEAREFLRPREEAVFHDPYLMEGMPQAVDRLRLAIERDERILIYGDYDVDGITGTVILYLGLKELGANVTYYIPNREHDGYGLQTRTIDRLVKCEGWQFGRIDMILTVDNGSAAVDAVRQAILNWGIDVVVTDHHECGNELPVCVIVNPKQPEETYPFRELSGAGVAYKLMCAMHGKDLRDTVLCGYAAIGTIADVMPMYGENRAIVQAGLHRLNWFCPYGLQQLIEESGGFDLFIDSTSVAFGLAPRLNAPGRVGDPRISAELLTILEYSRENEYRARDLVEKILACNDERKRLESVVQADINAMRAKENYLPGDDVSRILVYFCDGWNPGVLGIVASRMVEEYGRPCILLSIDVSGEENTLMHGSARSVAGVNIYQILTEASDLLDAFGGHELAAGLTLSWDKRNDFVERIRMLGEKYVPDEPFMRSETVDAVVPPDMSLMEAGELLRVLEPFGEGNPAPVLRIDNLRDVTCSTVGAAGAHTRFQMRRNGERCSAMLFGYPSDMLPYRPQEVEAIYGALSFSFYRGEMRPNFVVHNISARDVDLHTFAHIMREDHEKYVVPNENRVSRTELRNIYSRLLKDRFWRPLLKDTVDSVWYALHWPRRLARYLGNDDPEPLALRKLYYALRILESLCVLSFVWIERLSMLELGRENEIMCNPPHRLCLEECPAWQKFGKEDDVK